MSKNKQDRKSSPPTGGKDRKAAGEIKDSDLDKVSGGMSASGLPTGKRNHLPASADPCEGGE
jgi:hypothetical protein